MFHTERPQGFGMQRLSPRVTSAISHKQVRESQMRVDLCRAYPLVPKQ